MRQQTQISNNQKIINGVAISIISAAIIGLFVGFVSMSTGIGVLKEKVSKLVSQDDLTMTIEKNNETLVKQITIEFQKAILEMEKEELQKELDKKDKKPGNN